MPDFQAKIHFQAVTGIMARQVKVFIIPEGQPRTEVGTVQTIPVSAHDFYLGVIANTDYELEYVVITMQGSSAPTIIAFTTPPSVVPPPDPADVSISYEPNS